MPLGHSIAIRVDWDGEWWTISDEGGEFARATEVHQALRYVSDLMHGPPTYFDRDITKWAGVHGRTENLRDAD